MSTGNHICPIMSAGVDVFMFCNSRCVAYALSDNGKAWRCAAVNGPWRHTGDGADAQPANVINVTEAAQEDRARKSKKRVKKALGGSSGGG